MKIAGGSKGKSFNDRELAGRVRTLGLTHLEKILAPTYKDKKFQKEIISRLAPSLLPRLNEHTGADGGAILILPATLIDKNDTPPNTGDSSPEQAPVQGG